MATWLVSVCPLRCDARGGRDRVSLLLTRLFRPLAPRMRLAWVVRSPEPDLDDGKRSVVSPPNARAPRRRYGVAAAVKRGGPKLASFFFLDAFFPESTVDSDPI